MEYIHNLPLFAQLLLFFRYFQMKRKNIMYEQRTNNIFIHNTTLKWDMYGKKYNEMN